ncbi:MAG: hypothetical protein NTY64_20235 [Deltaproteobacteria bacterium]|nr:hypothetical protein [Deltaproteobacteria bacterium]
MAIRNELFQKEITLLKKFLELTRETAKTVKEGNFSACLPLLQARGGLLTELADGRKRMAQASAREPQIPKPPTVTGIINEMQALYQEIAVYDQGIAEKLQKEKDQIRDTLRNLRHGHKTLQGYNPRRVHIPRYCDKRG